MGVAHGDGGRGGVGAGELTLGQAGEVVEVAAAPREVEGATRPGVSVETPSSVSLITGPWQYWLLTRLMNESNIDQLLIVLFPSHLKYLLLIIACLMTLLY